nr:YceK/YidQ family lipoprotein [Pseudomonas khazarica]
MACRILTLYSLPADIVVDTVALPYGIKQVHN